MKIQTKEAAMKSATPKTELPPSTQLRKAVFGGARLQDAGYPDGCADWQQTDETGVSARSRAGTTVALLSAVFGLVCANPATCVAMDTNGLVAWWTADGNALDAAGSHSGTLSGGVAFAPVA